ncbi:general L-amino acid ABC transporter membrane protein [Faunimonas pinastri]|uniref:General L-amino acid ABC transporter membrane protein n=1 Tax=Faunimonas pinastri TaxID=1855383 RepID=A0A1H9CJC3_9HYPH|nr:amino acid ABC transporter permease [Faunimonas pinastri]SEQ01254.1 general L-amino acid ABC transporter membrane protein [Faunimonas pinastri]
MSDLQAQTDLFFVRRELATQEAPPAMTVGPAAWVKRNLFSTPGNSILTIIGIALIVLIVPPIINWAFINAVWTGTDRTACIAEGSGACWAFVKAEFAQFIYGRYPDAERWRVNVMFALLLLGLVPMSIPSAPFKRLNVLYLFIVFPVVSYYLLTGGFGLSVVETPLWGGLMLTVVVSYVGIVFSLPAGILLALGRRSAMPAVRFVCTAFIEIVRGIPLITVLFMSSVMLPLFLPQGVNFDKLLRALIGVALFASVYMAETVRGGMQAVPKGQYEGAKAVGLSYWPMMRLIILPQALKLVIPGIVGIFIALFKDTSLVYIIGLFDLLGIVRTNFADPNWASPETPATGLVFAAAVYWVFCFAMSRYSQYVERRLNTGRKR